MNPTASFFIKLAIFTSLSLQVCANDFLGSSPALSNIENELYALSLSRRQLQRRQAAEVAPVGALKAEEAKTSPATEDAAAKETGFKDRKSTKEEELATKMFETILEMGSGLELVTSLGSSTNEIVEQTKKVQSLVQKVHTFAQDLMSSVPKQSDSLSKSFSSLKEAIEELSKSLQAIEKTPNDANIIKENYKNLEKSFHLILSVADNVAISAIPKLAELFKGEEQGQGAAQVKSEEPKTGESKAGEAKTGELKAGEAKTGELKASEAKTGELNASEAKTGEIPAAFPQAADPKVAQVADPKVADPSATAAKPANAQTIEPIVPDVVVPQQ